MNPMSTEQSYEATWVDKLVTYDDRFSGRVESLSLFNGHIIIMLRDATTRLYRHEFPEEELNDHLKLSNGDITGGPGDDVFAHL